MIGSKGRICGSPRGVPSEGAGKARKGSLLVNGTFLVAGSVDVPFHQLSSRWSGPGFSG